ncbi:phytanoyl-CoA dioxygenase family protein [Edaphobacter sp.]|uniref:phytanoyl-CoA dioxygenase family protein n=1 Tax=Edaphobacter sp. TaxID=1934404 RepID=UPI00298122D0|nr:phytanoyl-CoA dioxygenase family protein [Edaphobacter sp.]
MLDDAIMDILELAVDRYVAGERDWLLPINLGDDGQGLNVVRQADYLSMQIKEFRSVVVHAAISSIAAQSASSPTIRLFHDQLVTKPPYTPTSDTRVGWHTDRAYWTTCSSKEMISAWVPVHDVSEEMGPLAVWDRSHLWPGVERLHNFVVTDLESIEAQFRAQGLEPEITTLPMRRGQVSFHHCRLVHGGYANRSKMPRYAYTIHMQDADNRYSLPTTTAGKQGHINDLLCRRTTNGLPDYSDPDVFPVLWPCP